jgi:hypothetical protein
VAARRVAVLVEAEAVRVRRVVAAEGWCSSRRWW